MRIEANIFLPEFIQKFNKYGVPLPSARMSYEMRIKLNMHPCCYQVLLNNPTYIMWDIIEYNRNNYPIYRRFPEKITWTALKQNPNLRYLLRSDLRQIKW